MATEVKPDVIKRTQDLLGKHIKKPPLTVKLLQKPPFRFLHDIITAVIRGTGFLDGVLTVEDMNHENIKDKEGKIAFLQKVIDAVAESTGTTLSVRPTKIVAGHEPTKTNELLQAIGIALEKRKNTSPAQQASNKKAASTKTLSSKTAVKEKEIPGSSPKATSSTKVASSTRASKSTVDTSKPVKGSRGAPSDRTKSKDAGKSNPANAKIHAKDSKTKGSTKDKKEKDDSRPAKENKKPTVAVDPMGDIVNVERQELPTPAEPANVSPDSGVNEDTKVEVNAHVDEESIQQVPVPDVDVKRPPSAHLRQRQPSAMKALAPALPLTKQDNAENIISPGTDRAERQPTRRPMSARPPSARPASARPAAPRVRDRGDVPLVSEPGPAGKVHVIADNDARKDDEEDEFLVVQTQPATVSEDKVSPTQLLEEGQHGHLVDQILETQKDLEEDRQEGTDQPSVPKKVGIEWEGGRKRDREAVRQEVARLRQTVQKTTRVVNPLGKLMDFVHEDVDSMQRELQGWRETNVRLATQLREEQRLTDQAVEPMKLQLQHLEESIQQKREHISALKATTIQNDIRTKMLLVGGE